MTETFNILRAVIDAEDGSAPAVRSFKNNVRSAERDATRFSSFLSTAGHRANRQYTVGLQQAGFQVGDFFTQIASGQNPMRAFIQQGTQLAGAFGAWGAILGAGASIVGALALSLWDGEEATRSFEEAFDDWMSKVDDLEGAVDNATAPLDDLKEKYGEVSDEIRAALELQAQFAAFEARQRYRETMRAVTDDDVFSTLNAERGMGQNPTQAGPGQRLNEIQKDLGLTRQEFDRIVQVMRDIDAAALTTSIEDDRKALKEAAGTLNELVNLSDEEMSDGFRDLANNLAKMLAELERAQEIREDAESGGLDLGGDTSLDRPGPTGPSPAALQGGNEAFLNGGGGQAITVSTRGSGLEGAISVAQEYKRAMDEIMQSAAKTADMPPLPPTEENNDRAEKQKEAMEDIVERIGRSATRARDWDDALQNVLMTALEIAGTGLFGAGPAGDFFNDAFGVDSGGIVQALFNAKGNVFDQGRVQPFARGGVVNGPTAFPMPGGVGVMGEAGPEAVMPLSRGPDGKLGVHSQGGGNVTVQMNITTPDVEGFRRSKAQIASEMQRVVGRAREF